MKSTSHASYQRHNNIDLAKKSRVASPGEEHSLNLAINLISAAKKADNETAFVAKLTEAFKLTRNVIRLRLD